MRRFSRVMDADSESVRVMERNDGGGTVVRHLARPSWILPSEKLEAELLAVVSFTPEQVTKSMLMSSSTIGAMELRFRSLNVLF